MKLSLVDRNGVRQNLAIDSRGIVSSDTGTHFQDFQRLLNNHFNGDPIHDRLPPLSPALESQKGQIVNDLHRGDTSSVHAVMKQIGDLMKSNNPDDQDKAYELKRMLNRVGREFRSDNTTGGFDFNQNKFYLSFEDDSGNPQSLSIGLEDSPSSQHRSFIEQLRRRMVRQA